MKLPTQNASQNSQNQSFAPSGIEELTDEVWGFDDDSAFAEDQPMDQPPVAEPMDSVNSESVSSASQIAPQNQQKPKKSQADSSVQGGKFKDRLKSLRKRNEEMKKAMMADIENAIIEKDATEYVLSPTTKGFLIEALKKEGLDVKKTSLGYSVDLMNL